MSAENTPFRCIVAGVDLELEDDVVLPAAVALARQADVPLVAVHDIPGVEPFLDPQARYAREGEDPYRRRVERLRARLAERLERLGAPAGSEARITFGAPAEQLRHLAEDLGAGLLIVGATRLGRLRRWLLGSTAESTLRHARVPVLVLRGAGPVAPERVLLATGLSPETNAAVARGVRLLADVLHRGRPAVRALTVVPLSALVAPISATEPYDPGAEEELAREAPSLVPEGWAVETLVRYGGPEHEIVAIAEAWPADLLIMGTHGRAGLSRLAMGSVAASVVRGAPCNVLVVPLEPVAAHTGAFAQPHDAQPAISGA